MTAGLVRQPAEPSSRRGHVGLTRGKPGLKIGSVAAMLGREAAAQRREPPQSPKELPPQGQAVQGARGPGRAEPHPLLALQQREALPSLGSQGSFGGHLAKPGWGAAPEGQAAPPVRSPSPGPAQAWASSSLPEAGWELRYEFCLAVNIISFFPFSLPC